ncbi:MAG TPA: hypothetical protein VM867_03635 [Xanthobacteraceae bacterium]|nr:hypothetical protein [Xanthobacteraceae bacterium]
MRNFACPHCHKQTISFWARQIISPIAPTECSNCTALIGMTWMGYLWPIVPFVIIWAIAEFYVEHKGFYWGLMVVGMVFWLWLSNQFVPLIVKEPPLPAKPAA